jgi:tripartite-type tricarboxylate transporter receptor subunit TctC
MRSPASESGAPHGVRGRKRAVAVVAGLALCGGTMAAAQTYPSRNVRLVAPFAPSGTNDVIARMVAQQLSDRLGRSFIVENRPGAGGVLANDLVAKSTPDGHTLLVSNPAFAMAAGLYKRLPYDTLRDFTPITEIMRAPSVLVVNPTLPVTTLKDFIAHARAYPDKLNYGSGGFGSALHLYSELFKRLAGVQITHVPFKGGGDNMAALLSGQVHMNIIQYQPSVLELIRVGRLRALAVTTDGKRSRSLPDVPSMKEAGIEGMDVYTWAGVVGPARMPQAIVDRLHAGIAAALNEPAVRDRFSGQDAEMVGSQPRAFSAFIQREIERWSEVIRKADIPRQ